MNNAYKWLKIKDRWSENSVCARCHRIYQELTNIGRWECSWHPGRKVMEDETRRTSTSGPSFLNPKIVWSCCGRHWTPNHEDGCIPCDHTMGRIELDTTDDVQGVHESWLVDLKCSAGSIIRAPDSQYVTVKRSK